MTIDLHPMLAVSFAVIWALVKIYRPRRGCSKEWSDGDE